MKQIILENHGISRQGFRRRDGEMTVSCGMIRSYKLKPYVGIRFKRITISLEE